MKDVISLAHGGGGRASQQLIQDVFLKSFSNPYLMEYADGAVIPFGEQRLAFATDSYTVIPLKFPGGSIASLAVNGTVNDLCMVGGIPQYLSAAFVIEEGFSLTLLQELVELMATSAKQAGVQIVTGDTKVLPRNQMDGLVINTAGIGVVEKSVQLGRNKVRPGDHILINGTIADHGITILTARENLGGLDSLASDCAPLTPMIPALLKEFPSIAFLRDPTRGGVAAVLNELVEGMAFGAVIQEEFIPVHPAIRQQCDLLGIDPLYVANEGKVILVCPPEDSAAIVERMRSYEVGQQASVIGKITEKNKGRVYFETLYGSFRKVDMPQHQQIPRIC
ncbi:MAG: hydrogenase expression/formation protein HypE [SAR324 cluster bacterium]|nr:hydrogenase expression/formation protein HypE [SAR324 cluster bacterium]